MFKHNILEWQSRGVRPNADYLATQRKIKRVKSENGTSTSLSEYEMTNMNYQTSNLNLPNGTQQIINVNQYTNQTYIINNINGDNLKIGDTTGFNNLNLNYNGYYGWPSSSNSNQFGQNELSMSSDMSSSNANSNLFYSQSLPPLATSIEDSLNDSIKDLIKTIYKFYHLNLNPLILINKDFFGKSYQTSQLALTYNGYQPTNSFNFSQTNGDNYYMYLSEVLKYFYKYAVHLANFLGNIPGNFLKFLFYFIKQILK